MNGRKLFFLLLIVVFVVFVGAHFAQGETLLETLRRGNVGWIAIAIAFQTLNLLNQPALYQALYAAFGLEIRWRDLLPLVLAGHFLNAVTPSAGLGATALLLSDARRRGFDMSRATLANTLYFAFNFAWFSALLLFSLALLARNHHLIASESLATFTLFALLLGAFSLLILLAWRPIATLRVLDWPLAQLNRAARRLLQRDLVAPDALRDFALGFGNATRGLRHTPQLWWRAVFHALLIDVLEIAVLGACFAAFPGPQNGIFVTWTFLVIGYSIGTLFLIVSVTPQGLGVVEGVMTAVFVGVGVPIERAAIAVLAYRGLSFWLPLFTGFLALRWTHNFNPNPTAQRAPLVPPHL